MRYKFNQKRNGLCTNAKYALAYQTILPDCHSLPMNKTSSKRRLLSRTSSSSTCKKKMEWIWTLISSLNRRLNRKSVRFIYTEFKPFNSCHLVENYNKFCIQLRSFEEQHLTHSGRMLNRLALFNNA